MTYRELEESTDRLAEEFRGVVRVVDVGRSRCGERVRAVVIGGGLGLPSYSAPRTPTSPLVP